MRKSPFIALAALMLLAACAGGSGGGFVRDLNQPGPAGDQRIVMWRKGASDRIDVTYRVDGKYDAAAFQEIDRMFRDRHNGDVAPIDPQLIDLIAGLRDRMVMAQDTPIELLSGYRSPETNENLSRTNKYVAKQSYHMRGMAADIRIPDMNSRALELVAKTIQKGGVALYPDSGHVHVDTGPVRGWEVIKGFEAGMEKKESAARAANREDAAAPEKAALIPIADKLPPVTVSKLPAPSAKLARNKPAGMTAMKPTSLKPLPKALQAKPVYSKTKKAAPVKAAPKKTSKKSAKKPAP